jgi:hypothetical protein
MDTNVREFLKYVMPALGGHPALQCMGFPGSPPCKRTCVRAAGMTGVWREMTKIKPVITRLVRVIYTSLIMDCPDEPGNDDIV